MPTNPDQTPWEGTHVYRVLKKKSKRWGRYAVISGWPTPVSEVVRTKFPPLPGRASYSIEARRWCKRVLRENLAGKKPKPGRRWIGAYSLRWLRAVAAGKRPLRYWEYTSLRTYLDQPKPVKQVVVPVRLNLRGWGQTAPVYQPVIHKAGQSGYGRGGYVTVPDIDVDEDED